MRYRKYPRLFLPLQRGPLHGFYHFFVGYFLPTFWFARDKVSTEFCVVDSGQFNDWFDVLPDKPREIVSKDKALKVAFRSRLMKFANGYRVAPIIGWDKSNSFSTRPFQEIATKLNLVTSQEARQVKTRRPDVLVFGRDFLPESYEHMPNRYGAGKRDIPNLSEVSEQLSRYFDLEHIDPAALPPMEVIAKCQSAKVVVGQHGAALTNLFFLPPGSTVIEIGWKALESEAELDMYRLLSEKLGHNWVRPLLQEDRYSSINCEDLRPFVSDALK